MLPKLLRTGLVHTPSVSESGKFLFQGFGAQQENRGTADEIFVMAKIYMAHSSFELHHLYDGRYRIQVKSVGKFANNINKIHCIKQTKKLFSRGLQFGHVRGGGKKIPIPDMKTFAKFLLQKRNVEGEYWNSARQMSDISGT